MNYDIYLLHNYSNILKFNVLIVVSGNLALTVRDSPKTNKRRKKNTTGLYRQQDDDAIITNIILFRSIVFKLIFLSFAPSNLIFQFQLTARKSVRFPYMQQLV